MTREQIHLRDALEICGCCSDEPVKFYLHLCNEIRDKKMWSWTLFEEKYGEGVAYALLCHLEMAGVIEHGTTIRWPWIRPEWERKILGPTDFEKNNPGMIDEDLDI